MKCLDYSIRVRTLGSGLFNAMPAITTHGRTGTTLTEVLVECCSGPSTSRHLAIRMAEERTQAYLANQYASVDPLPLAILRWNKTAARRVRDTNVDRWASDLISGVALPRPGEEAANLG